MSLPRKLVPFVALVLCVLLAAPLQYVQAGYFNGYNNKARGGYAAQSFGSYPAEGAPLGYGDEHDYEYDYEVSETAKADRARMSTHEFLEHHGLDEIADRLSDLIKRFDTSTRLLDRLKVDMLNAIISHFRDSFVHTVDEAKRTMDTASGTISLSNMRDFLRRQEQNFGDRLQAEAFYPQWASLLSQTHVIFESLGRLYQLSIEGGMPLSWWILQVLAPIASNIPDHLLDAATFGELLKLPATLQAQLHDSLESIFTSGYGPVAKILIQTLVNMAVSRHDEL